MAEMAAPLVAHTRVPILASLMVFGAGLVWSLGALTTRLSTSTDAWQYLIWRSVGIVVVMEVITRLRGRRSALVEAYTSGWLMITACLSLWLASVAFIYALKNTTAANTAFLASVTPLVAVILARIFLGERLTRVTVGAIALALVGLAIMVSADLGAGRMSGNVAAVLSSVGFASYTVCIRARPAQDWSPVLPGYGSMMIVICSIVTIFNGRPLVPPAIDAAYALFHGGVLIVLGTILFNIASRTVPAVAMTVLAQSETVFVPVWVFLAFGEQPGLITLIGAAIILTAVVGKAALDARPGEPASHRAVPGA
ncbi:MAG: DMT family transporter [Acidimicrobiia bacterium]